MLLLTATSTPLSTTDARYIYRCLDASDKQAIKLVSLLTATPKLTKTFLSRCQSLAQSIHKKVSRCVPVLGTRNPEFNEVLDSCTFLTQNFSSKLTFPSRFRTQKAQTFLCGGFGLLDRIKATRASIRVLLEVVGEILAARSGGQEGQISGEKDASQLEDFFTKAERDKGWKIQREDSSKTAQSTATQRDTFGIGCQVVKDLTLPYNTLLDDEIEVGLVSFSIILLEAYRLPETVLSTCGTIAPLHKVFGSYVVLQNATLMGIHQDLMQVIKEGKNKVDEERFRHLIPYLSKNYPDTQEVLARTFPSGPTKFARHHYYSPLLPRQLINTPRFSLGNWSFLTDRTTRTRPEHSRSSS
jgi:hypothetical protein